MPSQIRLRMESPGQVSKKPAQPQLLRLMRKVRYLLLGVWVPTSACHVAVWQKPSLQLKLLNTLEQ